MLTRKITGVLAHNFLGISLIFSQAILACVVISLSLAFIIDGMTRIAVETGADEQGLEAIEFTDIGDSKGRVSRRKSYMSRFSSIPGIESVALVSHIPFGEGETSFGVCANSQRFEAAVIAGSIDVPGCAMPAGYGVSLDGLSVLGVRLIQGRNFQAADYDTDAPKVAIVSHAFGKSLYGDQPILGQVMQAGPDRALTIIGVTNDIIRPHPLGRNDDYHVIFTPEWSQNKTAFYLTRIGSGYSARRIMSETIRLLTNGEAGIIVNDIRSSSLQGFKHRYYSKDYALIEILMYLILCLVLVTSIGCSSLTWLWVEKRRRSIGIRRALGATFGDIIKMVLCENLMIVVSGAIAGIVLVFLALPWLRELNVVSANIIAISATTGFIGTILLGQIAALIPALRAAKIEPSIAVKG